MRKNLLVVKNKLAGKVTKKRVFIAAGIVAGIALVLYKVYVTLKPDHNENYEDDFEEEFDLANSSSAE